MQTIPSTLYTTPLLLAICCTVACTTPDGPHTDLNTLPELPSADVVLLDTLPGGQVLITRASYTRLSQVPTGSDPEGEGSSTPLPLRACTSNQKFSGYMAYPATVCSPLFPDLQPTDILLKRSANTHAPKAEAPKDHVLTTQRRTLWCRTHGGPWYVEVIEHTECSNVVWCSLDLVGAPVQFHTEWLGTANEVPEDLALVISIQGMPWMSPCGRLTNCGGSIDPPDHF